MNITDIARMAGVSKGTVSRVINENPEGVSAETRKRIKQIIEDVGYVPNRVAGSIANAKTKTVGIIIPDIQNAFFPQVVKGIEEKARAEGYAVFLGNTNSNIKQEEQYLWTFLEKRVDGIILSTCGDVKDDKLLRSLHVSGIPIVLMDRKTKTFGDIPGVYVDNRGAALEGVRYLLQKGMHRIAYLGGNNCLYTSRERYKGYVMALEEAGIALDPELTLFGEFSIASGAEMVEKIKPRLSEVDAIFAGSDMTAIGALRALRKFRIKVPEDMELLGFDNIELSSVVTPALTTMGQPMYEIGYRTFEKLLRMISGEACREESEYLRAELILRETTT